MTQILKEENQVVVIVEGRFQGLEMLREIGPIVNIGPDIFEVPSTKIKKDGIKKTDVYIVDLASNYCQCRAWHYSKMPKKCPHLNAVTTLLRAGGHCIHWNKKEKCHYDLGLIK